MEMLYVLNEEDPNYELKNKIFERNKKKLGRCARFYLWINSNYVNQVYYIDTIDESKKVKDLSEKGIFRQSNDLQNAMKRDINLILEAKLYSEKKSEEEQKKKQEESKKDDKEAMIKLFKKEKEYQINLEDMPETSEFLRFERITIAVLDSIPNALLSQAAHLCYLCMILSMILNAGLISILYPFAVFGYALMEEGRPKKSFWTAMSYYTILILTLKLVVQLDIWYMLGIDSVYYSIDVRVPCIYTKIGLLDLWA
jgi:hypothetical protein